MYHSSRSTKVKQATKAYFFHQCRSKWRSAVDKLFKILRMNLTVFLSSRGVLWGIQPHHSSVHGDGLLLPRVPHRALAGHGLAAVAGFGRNCRRSRPPRPLLLEVSSLCLVFIALFANVSDVLFIYVFIG